MSAAKRKGPQSNAEAIRLKPHTPGPWFAGDQTATFNFIRARGCTVAGVIPQQNALANAFLIAAAPDLLVALIDMLEYHEHLRGDRTVRRPIERAARKAIRKAMGAP